MLPDLEQELQDLRSRDLYRAPLEIESAQGPRVVIDGKERLLFCSNNYLGLANHPALKELARVALDTFGCGTAASRLVSGNMSIHNEMESHLARFLGTESALSFPTGYMANLGVVPTLVGPEDIIFSDRLNHRSIIDACRLSRAKTVVYNHRDTDHLAELLSTETDYRRRLIVTDGLFSMDGDLAPIPELVALSRSHDTILMVDDAHGTGVLGPSGRGIHEHFGITEGIDVLMTAGSKALGTFGGFIAGSRVLTDLLINRSPSFIYTTALAPDTCAATLAALDLIEEDSSYREKLQSNVDTVTRELTALGFDIMNSRSQIIPVLVGDAGRTMDISRRLFDQGIFLSGIRPPTVPQGESRLRLTLMSNHNEDDISQLLEAMSGIRDTWV
jgi:8-amino-7-oxononanoate synthase